MDEVLVYPNTWAWLAVGLIPNRIERKQPSRHELTVTLRALFWTLEVRRRRTCRTWRTDWILRIPLFERVRDAVWAARKTLAQRHDL